MRHQDPGPALLVLLFLLIQTQLVAARTLAPSAGAYTDDHTVATAGTDCCRLWEGVRCGHGDGRVTSLDLGGRGLESAGLDTSLFHLSSLEYLDLAYNDFNVSQLPSDGFERLSKLTHLNLSSSSFSGEIPIAIGRLTNLLSLDLSTSFEIVELDGDGYIIYHHTKSDARLLMPNFEYLISNLINLRELHLGFVDLSDNGVKWCNLIAKSSPKLELRRNNFEGWISSTIFQLKKLVTIDLYHNPNISGCLPEFFASNVLENLIVGTTNFSGTIPNSIGNLKWLKKLDLSGAGFSDLEFSYCGLSGSIPAFLGGLRKLERNSLHGKIPSSICGASIQLLDLSYNNLSGSIPPCLMENVNTMISLNLKANKLLGELPDNINKGCSFEALDFSGNEIVGRLPRSLVACKNLKVIDVGNNQMNDSFPCWMSTLRGLEVIILKSNNFFGHVAQSLVGEGSTCVFPGARIVDLSSNNFYGPLPQDEWFMNLTSMILRDSNAPLFMAHGVPQIVKTYDYTIAMTYKGHDTTFPKIFGALVFIDFSNNAFYGSIPEAIGGLVLLNGLNMSHNSLMGPIPAQLGRLKHMEALDLSSNKLSGVIPQELASLNFLETLNLSYNKLKGRIPESTQFSTFSNSSFLGNDDLCGPPLTKGCNNMTSLNYSRRQKIEHEHLRCDGMEQHPNVPVDLLPRQDPRQGILLQRIRLNKSRNHLPYLRLQRRRCRRRGEGKEGVKAVVVGRGVGAMRRRASNLLVGGARVREKAGFSVYEMGS
ncbi:hypothetical protein GUJ93_ZPchr0008g13976 [Zizania palustris]|uniref:Leucine-rich repeat-containing N-terminal plant-type domain-containing protein n=1 Tax=Zizania palustris TaxID=103762 RepID=A0A8J5RHQ1_ZIZPA|nr:hypothetical protein GUJ93_ZPchr0008g13976 [Zizania palustris]